MNTNAPIPFPIEVEDVSYSYDGVKALDHVSLSIKEGEYVAIIGPNGAGKSTLLKAILGLLSPQTGSIRLFGQPINSFDKKFQLGYVPQRISASSIQFPCTVTEVIESGCTAKTGLFHNINKKDRQKMDWAMHIAGVEKLRNTSINQLSGGQLQRVYIARALASEPKILFLDEPTVGVDLETQEKFYDFIKTLNKDFGITILIVTHEVDVAVHRAKSVICLNRKLLCHIPSTQLLYGNYLQDLYGGHVHVVPHEHYPHHHA
ncbi:MAG: metal ABC transporter ATP-binding protein [Patescibacteria group bacterium]